MFLSAVSAISFPAIEGIHVVTNVARLSRAWPSSSSSDEISSYAMSRPRPESRSESIGISTRGSGWWTGAETGWEWGVLWRGRLSGMARSDSLLWLAVGSIIPHLDT